MFEFFDHTADLGIRVRATALEQLYEHSLLAITSAMIENQQDLCPTDARTIEVRETNQEFRLFDVLNEALYWFESERWLLAEVRVNLNEDFIRCEVAGEHFDPSRHQLSHEVKAITYHELKVEPSPDGWLAEWIVDI